MSKKSKFVAIFLFSLLILTLLSTSVYYVLTRKDIRSILSNFRLRRMVKLITHDNLNLTFNKFRPTQMLHYVNQRFWKFQPALKARKMFLS